MTPAVSSALFALRQAPSRLHTQLNSVQSSVDLHPALRTACKMGSPVSTALSPFQPPHRGNQESTMNRNLQAFGVIGTQPAVLFSDQLIHVQEFRTDLTQVLADARVGTLIEHLEGGANVTQFDEETRGGPS